MIDERQICQNMQTPRSPQRNLVRMSNDAAGKIDFVR
jgi:hypothetical protein